MKKKEKVLMKDHEKDHDEEEMRALKMFLRPINPDPVTALAKYGGKK